MPAILGISAFYHDAAAALVVDGEIVAAAQEERFSRKKHDPDFPARAIEFCLKEAGISPEQLDYVGFYDKPLLKFERLLETYLAFAPAGFLSFARAMPVWLREKLYLPRTLRRGLNDAYKKRFVFTEHHESHAASAFFPSPFDEAAILTVDGVGEWATASYGTGRGNRIELTHELHFPHSPGLLYSAFTYYCGFRVNSGEYKLMGLAPYGEPKYADLIREKLLDLKADGSFRMDQSYFEYCHGWTMTSEKFHRLFGGPPRKPESPIDERHMDLAASIQQVTEEIMLRMARHVRAETGMKHLCLAGGVALNCVANGRILREGPFENLWIQPAAGDAGGALGVALFIHHQLLGNERVARKEDSQHGSLLGPRFDDDEIRAFLNSIGAKYSQFADDDSLCERVAELIADEKVVGWLCGRMEFGPRALGGRSILGDARSRKMQSVMNLKIKFRESFRPFAPSVLRDRAAEWFDLRDDVESPYMLLVADVRAEKRVPQDGEARRGFERLEVPRSEVPAITHVDHSARLQTVDPHRHGRYHRLLEKFAERTGTPVLINTSFNVRGEPIVRTPEEAHRCFMATNMDALVLERFVLLKKDQPHAEEHRLDEYLATFELD
ncbi:MAG: carbamoyltransferase [Planctomycetaceae bacterium]